MNWAIVSSFFMISVIGAASPGPDSLCVLTESLTRGRRRAFVLALGLASGVLVHTTLCATGLSALIVNFDAAFYAIKLFSFFYLAYLSFCAFKEGACAPQKYSDLQSENPQIRKLKSLPALYLQGFLMNVSNPKVIIFFLAFLPTFVKENAKLSTFLQFYTLGLTFMLATIVVFGAISVLAASFRPYLAKTAFWKIERYVRMFLFGGLAIYALFW